MGSRDTRREGAREGHKVTRGQDPSRLVATSVPRLQGDAEGTLSPVSAGPAGRGGGEWRGGCECRSGLRKFQRGCTRCGDL